MKNNKIEMVWTEILLKPQTPILIRVHELVDETILVNDNN